MRSTRCLRLACRPTTPQACSRLICSSAPARLRPGAPIRTPVRALSTAPDGRPKPSRFANEPEGRGNASPFKQHRQEELWEDQQSEEPLYPDPYPRLESSALRKSVPEFLEDFHERLSHENVSLTGRIRSKRVVGKSLIFLDIVNEFQKVQVMINKNKCVSEKNRRIHKFALFKNLIQVGDHICRLTAFPPMAFPLADRVCSGHWHCDSYE